MPASIQTRTSPDPLSHAVSRAALESRQKCGWSQRQLAAEMNVPRTYISKIENGGSNPTLASIDRLCEATGVTLSEFMLRVDGIRLLCVAADAVTSPLTPHASLDPTAPTEL